MRKDLKRNFLKSLVHAKNALSSADAKVKAYDPEAMPNVKADRGDKIKYADIQYQAIEGADALILVTEWSEFRIPDFEQMGMLIEGKV